MMESSWIFNIMKNKILNASEFTVEEEEEELKCLLSDKINPYSENYMLIQKSHNEKMKLQKEIERLKERENKILAILGNEVFDFSKCLNSLKAKMVGKELIEEFSGLEILQKKMHQILKENGFEIIDLTGEPVNNELLKHIEVLKNIKEEGIPKPFVKKTIRPLVFHDSKLIQTGTVIVAIPSDKNGG